MCVDLGRYYEGYGVLPRLDERGLEVVKERKVKVAQIHNRGEKDMRIKV